MRLGDAPVAIVDVGDEVSLGNTLKEGVTVAVGVDSLDVDVEAVPVAEPVPVGDELAVGVTVAV